MTKFSIKKKNSNKTKPVPVESELKKQNTFVSSYFRGKNNFEEDVHKIIWYFSQFTDILKGLFALVVVIIFNFGNLKNCVMKLYKSYSKWL